MKIAGALKQMATQMSSAVTEYFDGGDVERPARIFSFPGDIVDRLPDKIAMRVIDLRQAKDDALVLSRALADELNGFQDTKHQHENRIRSLMTATGNGGFGLPKEHPSVTSEQEKLKKVEANIKRLSALQSSRSDNWNAVGGLLESLERYLSQFGAEDKITEHDAPPVKLLKGQSPNSAVEACRARIERLRQDLNMVKSAPITTARAKEIARNQIMAFAERGRPDVTSTINHGEPVSWPSVEQTPLTVYGSKDRIVVYPNGNDGSAMLAWVHRDALIARIEAEIDAESDDSKALTDEDRCERMTSIRSQILATEREEEAHITAALDAMSGIVRRRDADPRAVLGLADSLPAPRDA